MKKLTYTKANFLTKLHEELLALPALQSAVGASGYREAVFTIFGDGNTVTLVVPDGTDEAAIAAIVNAHDATPPAPKPTAKQTVDAALALVDVSKPAIALAALKTILSTVAGKLDR